MNSSVAYNIESSTLNKIRKRIKNNDLIGDFLLQKSHDYTLHSPQNNLYWNRQKRIRSCCNYWGLDYYRLQNVKYVKTVSRCKDKFCSNCQSQAANDRYNKFVPIFKAYASDKGYQHYHVVLSVPNCPQDQLQSVIDRMFKSFAQLTQYLKGQRKVTGIDFLNYGYRGCVRSLEVTPSKVSDGFHPHFHCCFSFSRSFNLGRKRHVNDYSFSYGVLNRKFSDFEIFLQRLWRCCYDGSKVTANRLDSMDLGYSCVVDRMTDDGFRQVFKYAIKGCFSKNGKFLFQYDAFDRLDRVLYHRRLIQGYGCYFGIKFESDDLFTLFAYVEDIATGILQEVEFPVDQIESFDAVELGCKRSIYISTEKILEFFQRFTAKQQVDLDSMVRQYFYYYHVRYFT